MATLIPSGRMNIAVLQDNENPLGGVSRSQIKELWGRLGKPLKVNVFQKSVAKGADGWLALLRHEKDEGRKAEFCIAHHSSFLMTVPAIHAGYKHLICDDYGAELHRMGTKLMPMSMAIHRKIVVYSTELEITPAEEGSLRQLFPHSKDRFEFIPVPSRPRDDPAEAGSFWMGLRTTLLFGHDPDVTALCIIEPDDVAELLTEDFFTLPGVQFVQIDRGTSRVSLISYQKIPVTDLPQAGKATASPAA